MMSECVSKRWLAYKPNLKDGGKHSAAWSSCGHIKLSDRHIDNVASEEWRGVNWVGWDQLQAFTTEPLFNPCVCVCACAWRHLHRRWHSNQQPCCKIQSFSSLQGKTCTPQKQACCLQTPHALDSQCKMGGTPQTQGCSDPHPPLPSHLLLPSILANPSPVLVVCGCGGIWWGCCLIRWCVGGDLVRRRRRSGSFAESAAKFTRWGSWKTLHSYSIQPSSDLLAWHLNLNFQAQPQGKCTFRRWSKAIIKAKLAIIPLPFNLGNQDPVQRAQSPSVPEEDRQLHWLQHKTRAAGRGKTHVLCCSPWPDPTSACSSGPRLSTVEDKEAVRERGREGERERDRGSFTIDPTQHIQEEKGEIYRRRGKLK